MKWSILGVLLFVACSGKETPEHSLANAVPSSPSEKQLQRDRSHFTSSARTVFDKKRVCAEEGRRYFERLDKTPVAGADEWTIVGPVFAYNAKRDTCLCEWGWSYRDRGDKATHQTMLIDDIFTNMPLAQYSVREKEGEPESSSGDMSRDEFGRREKELPGPMQ